MSISTINPVFNEFPDDIRDKLIERSKKEPWLLIENKEEIEKKLEEEEKKKTVREVFPEIAGAFKKTDRLMYLENLFDTQVQTFLKKEYPKHAGMSEKEFLSHILPLREKLVEVAKIPIPEGHIPFVIVIGEKLLSLEKKIPLMELEEKKGFTSLDLSEFKTAEGVDIPEGMAYLVVDVENGKVMLGKSPDEAIKQFKKEGRSPLTTEEGVAVITRCPEILKDRYMDLSGSRLGAYNVASLWLSGGGPRLDWDRADGSFAKWGSASCGSRVGP